MPLAPKGSKANQNKMSNSSPGSMKNNLTKIAMKKLGTVKGMNNPKSAVSSKALRDMGEKGASKAVEKGMSRMKQSEKAKQSNMAKKKK
jgi:hypothetical protein